MPLNFVMVYCTRSADSFAAARAERLKVSGNPGQYDDLGLFVREQAVLDRLIGESRLPVCRVDVSDNDIAGAVNRIADWMEANDRLVMAD